MIFWPTLLGQCITCRGFPAHPAGSVPHLPWFSWPTLPGWCTTCNGFLAHLPDQWTTCRGFLAHPAGQVHHLLWFSWPTLLGRCTTCRGYLGPPCQASALLAVAFQLTLPGRCTTCHSFLAHPAWPMHHLPQFPGSPCWAGRCTTCHRFLGPPCRAGVPAAMAFLAALAGLEHQLLWSLEACY